MVGVAISETMNEQGCLDDILLETGIKFREQAVHISGARASQQKE